MVNVYVIKNGFLLDKFVSYVHNKLMDAWHVLLKQSVKFVILLHILIKLLLMVNVNVWLNIGSMIKFANYAAKKSQVVQHVLKMDQDAWHVMTNPDNQPKTVFHVNANHSLTKMQKTKLANHAIQNILVSNAHQITIMIVSFATQMVIGIKLLSEENVNVWMGTMNMMGNAFFVWFLAVQYVHHKLLVNNAHKIKVLRKWQYKMSANANPVLGYQTTDNSASTVTWQF